MYASVLKHDFKGQLTLSIDDLVAYAVWISVELNTVIIAASVPVLRPLFRRNGLSRIAHPQSSTSMHCSPEEAYETSGSGAHDSVISYSMSTFKSGTRTRRGSVVSTEEILTSSRNTDLSSLGGITRTVEVEVTSTSRERTIAHATLVGLPMGMPSYG